MVHRSFFSRFSTFFRRPVTLLLLFRLAIEDFLALYLSAILQEDEKNSDESEAQKPLAADIEIFLTLQENTLKTISFSKWKNTVSGLHVESRFGGQFEAKKSRAHKSKKLWKFDNFKNVVLPYSRWLLFVRCFVHFPFLLFVTGNPRCTRAKMRCTHPSISTNFIHFIFRFTMVFASIKCKWSTRRYNKMGSVRVMLEIIWKEAIRGNKSENKRIA